MAETANNPFSRATVLVLVLVGSLAFLGLLYGLGSGDFSRQDNNGEGHAASDSLIGYSALADVLTKTGNAVTLGRSAASFDDINLLIVTPSQYTNSEELSEMLDQRRYSGPTLIILPKWFTQPAPDLKTGWVQLLSAVPFKGEIGDKQITTEITGTQGPFGDPFAKAANEQSSDDRTLQSGFGKVGNSPAALATLKGGDFVAMVRDGASGAPVVAYLGNGGYHPKLSILDEPQYSDEEYEALDFSRYPVIVAADPDLFNNMGMADKTAALHALSLIDAVKGGENLPVVFDLTFNGLGSSENLLTLAFRPPFLAATLCFLIAAVIVGWQTFARFAPPVLAGRSINFGKTALVRNSAAMLKLMSRQHLLREPYLAMVRRKSARALGLSASMDEAELTAQFDKASADDKPPFSVLENALARASKPYDIARAATQLDIWKKDNL